MAQFSIGSFYFITLESDSGRGGAPPLPQTHTEIVQRAGVDGTGFIDLGSKGDVFQMRSLVDVADEFAAHTLIAAYRGIVGTALQNLVWRDIDYSVAHSVKFAVLGVTNDRLQVVANVSGGLSVANGFPAVIVEVIWHLQPVAV